ncbi:MAG: LysR family transcriptional regulator [Gordonibacter sp.]|uniref:LysR family transcriptional regulator n=1 Tax=Gordonibacter sp. TaxID=1968902 RepID=UPI002FC5DC1A
MQDFRMATFLNVCRTLSYTRSAAALNITQPAVSQHIAFLEKSYGTKLFAYRGKKLSLTTAGELLREAAATMAHDEDTLRESIAAMTGLRRSLRIGMTLTAGEYVLAPLLPAYLAVHEDVQARIFSGDTGFLLEQLRAGEIDCALVEGVFDRSAYDWRVFGTERMVAVCAAGHPLAQGKKPLRFDDLLEQHVLVREQGSGTRAVLVNALAERNLSVDSFARVTEVESINIIKVLVEGGYGISFLYEAAVRRELVSGQLARIPLAGRAIEHELTFLSLKGSVFAGELARLFDDLTSAAKQAE